MSEVVIKIENLSKVYRLGVIGSGTLKEDINRYFSKKKGIPTAPITTGDDSQINSFNEFKALDNISLDIHKGEAIGIIGHNGAGKSTLLKILSRITAPTDGELFIKGKITSMLEVGTGFHGEMTGRENIYMNGAILGMSKKEIDSKIDDIIEFSECGKFIDTPVKRYSSGMYVKLAFSVASHLDSDIMIMDEVLAVGDVAFQKKCLDRMFDLATKDHKTILYVSHNIATIKRLCTKCIVLNKGKIEFYGDVNTAIELYIGKDINNDIMPTAYNFTELVPSSEINVNSLRFVGCDNCKYTQGENINIELNWNSFNCTRELKARFILRYIDGSIVGSFMSEGFNAKNANGVNTTTLSIPANRIPDGKYYFIFDILSDNYMKSVEYTNLQTVLTPIMFEIIKTDENALGWKHNFWGHVNFDKIKVL